MKGVQYLNREQTRKVRKDARKKGIDKAVTELYISMKKDGFEKPSTPQEINTGDSVCIDVEKVTARKNYAKMAPEYREFVESSAGRVFTANVEQGNLVSMQEEPKWLFWSGDLEVIKPSQEKEGDD